MPTDPRLEWGPHPGAVMESAESASFGPFRFGVGLNAHGLAVFWVRPVWEEVHGGIEEAKEAAESQLAEWVREIGRAIDAD